MFEEFGSDPVMEFVTHTPMFSPQREHTDVVAPWQDRRQSPELFGVPSGFDAYLPSIPTTVVRSLRHDFTVAVSDGLHDKNTAPSFSRLVCHAVGRSIISHHGPDKGYIALLRVIRKLVLGTFLWDVILKAESIEESTTEIAQPTMSPPHHEAKSNGELIQFVLSEQVPLAEFDATNYGGNVVSTVQSCTAISHSEKENARETLERKHGRNKSSFSLEDQQHFGWKRVDAAESFGDLLPAVMEMMAGIDKHLDICSSKLTLEAQSIAESTTEIAQLARSPPHHEAESNGGELMQPVLSEQVSLVEFGSTNYGGNVVSAVQSCTAVSHSEKKNARETLERKYRRFKSSFSLKDQQHFGWKCKDAAKSDAAKSVGEGMEGVNTVTIVLLNADQARQAVNTVNIWKRRACHPRKTISSDCLAEIGNQVLGSSISNHEKVLEEQNGSLPAFGLEEDSMDLCHNNDPARDPCGSSTHKESLEARGSPKLTIQPTELTSTTVYPMPSSLAFTKPQTDLEGVLNENMGSSNDLRYLFPSEAETFLDGQIVESLQTELPCSDPTLKQDMVTLPHAVPHVTTRKNAGIVTKLQKETENLMTTPCWSSASELEVFSPSLLAPIQSTGSKSPPCLTESTAQHNIGQVCFLEEERSVEIGNPSVDEKLESTLQCIQIPTRSSLSPEVFSNGVEITEVTRLESSDMNCTIIPHPKMKKIIETPERKCRITKDDVSLEDLQQYFDQKRLDAAKSLGVSVSTLKRVSRKRGISRWPFRNKKNECSLFKPKLVTQFVQGAVGAFSPTTSSHTDAGGPNYKNSQGSKPPEPQGEKMTSRKILPSIGGQAEISDQMLESRLSAHEEQLQEQNKFHLQKQDMKIMTIKATYGEDTVRLSLCSTSGIVELKKELAKKLELEYGCFNVKYQDEDLEWVLMTCDADLHDCVITSSPTGNQVIRLMVLDKVVNSRNSGKVAEQTQKV